MVYLRKPPPEGFWWDEPGIFKLGLSSMALVVRFYLVSCANQEGLAWPSLQTIANHTGLSRASVIRAIQSLIDRGLVERVSSGQGRYSSSVYRVVCVCDLLIPSNGITEERFQRATVSRKARSKQEPNRDMESMVSEGVANSLPVSHRTRSIEQDSDLVGSGTDRDSHGNCFSETPMVVSGGRGPLPLTLHNGVVSAWESMSAQVVSSVAAEKLCSYLDDGLTEDLIIRVMRGACEINKYRLDYVYAILNRLVSSGITTVDEYEREQARFLDGKRQSRERVVAVKGGTDSRPNASSEDFKRQMNQYLERTGGLLSDDHGTS